MSLMETLAEEPDIISNNRRVCLEEATRDEVSQKK